MNNTYYYIIKLILINTIIAYYPIIKTIHTRLSRILLPLGRGHLAFKTRHYDIHIDRMISMLIDSIGIDNVIIIAR